MTQPKKRPSKKAKTAQKILESSKLLENSKTIIESKAEQTFDATDSSVKTNPAAHKIRPNKKRG